MTDLTLSRRRFLALASSFVAVAATPIIGSSALSARRRRFSVRELSLYNVHTQETFQGTYWREGHYNEKALQRLAYVLRDRRNQKQHPIDPSLFDILHRLQATLGGKEEYQIICGYRSPETNAKLHRTSSGVAKKKPALQGESYRS